MKEIVHFANISFEVKYFVLKYRYLLKVILDSYVVSECEALTMLQINMYGKICFSFLPF